MVNSVLVWHLSLSPCRYLLSYYQHICNISMILYNCCDSKHDNNNNNYSNYLNGHLHAANDFILLMKQKRRVEGPIFFLWEYISVLSINFQAMEFVWKARRKPNRRLIRNIGKILSCPTFFLIWCLTGKRLKC